MSSARYTILFQGDSITDTGRERSSLAANDPAAMGRGYAFLAMCRLLAERPNAGLRVYNRGISGNRVPELKARWEPDCLELAPDVLGILIGVNDIWHKMDGRIRAASPTTKPASASCSPRHVRRCRAPAW